MMQNWGLKKKFFIIFLVLITLPTTLYGIFIYSQTTEVLKNQVEEDILERLNKDEQNLLSIIRDVESMSSYMIYSDDFRRFFTTAEETSSTYKNSVNGIKGYFTFQLMSNEYISSIQLQGMNGNKLEFGEPVFGDEENLDEAAAGGKGAPIWSDTYKVTSGWGGEKYVISLSRVINDLNRITYPIGTVRIRLDQEKIMRSLEVKQGHYLVMSKSGEIILHSNQKFLAESYDDPAFVHWVNHGEELVHDFTIHNQDYKAVKKELSGTNWTSVVMVDEKDLVKELFTVRKSIRNMIILLLLLGVVAFYGFYRSNVKRVIELTIQTEELEKGNFSAKVDVSANDEIGRLGMRFNKMVKTIQRYIDTEYKLKIKQKESELNALQNQIDPHFLYNTLDMIRWSARLENAMETSEQIEQLSKVFRMNLNNGKTWVSIEEEIAYINSYLDLQKSRLGERLAYFIFIDHQIKKSFIMKQLIQPLVENSIQHGFKELPHQGIITIRCYQVEEQVWIDVIDNGWGIEKGDHDTGYAMQNLKERLAIAFGAPFGIQVVEVKQGAKIRLILPLLLNSQENL
ncbi:two-component system sensor histidine kinase YesM [Lederbergia galactosidilyticus]|uniref:cache domain-containing sensor histidine kinase n=1 Tax=Lederbergia galactosidilytica TaxID=217031 RepID=UPI001DF058CB|nr:histidine kinase [Lederbergia galactosidilytica]MBP1915829.1 two-component system sensor histidine kinase YesM [Lederbergia galactosidilytica]